VLLEQHFVKQNANADNIAMSLFLKENLGLNVSKEQQSSKASWGEPISLDIDNFKCLFKLLVGSLQCTHADQFWTRRTIEHQMILNVSF